MSLGEQVETFGDTATSDKSRFREAAGAPGAVRHGGHRRRLPPVAAVFVLPFYIVFALFSLVPLGYALYLSLFTQTITGAKRFVGLGNFKALFASATFWTSLLHVGIFALVVVPCDLALAALLAAVIDLRLTVFPSVFRLLIFVPFAVPGVLAAIMWGYMFSPNISPFDIILGRLGVSEVNFLGSSLVWIILGVIVLWESVGFNMLLIYTGFQAVPAEVNEAALLDGASIGQLIWRVRLPLARKAVGIAAIFAGIAMLQLFTEPEVLQPLTTSIGDGFTPNFFLYTTAFSADNANGAAAGGFVLALIIVVLTGLAFVIRKWVMSR